jgi:hypothetical protein
LRSRLVGGQSSGCCCTALHAQHVRQHRACPLAQPEPIDVSFIGQFSLSSLRAQHPSWGRGKLRSRKMCATARIRPLLAYKSGTATALSRKWGFCFFLSGFHQLLSIACLHEKCIPARTTLNPFRAVTRLLSRRSYQTPHLRKSLICPSVPRRCCNIHFLPICQLHSLPTPSLHALLSYPNACASR